MSASCLPLLRVFGQGTSDGELLALALFVSARYRCKLVASPYLIKFVYLFWAVVTALRVLATGDQGTGECVTPPYS